MESNQFFVFQACTACANANGKDVTERGQDVRSSIVVKFLSFWHG